MTLKMTEREIQLRAAVEPLIAQSGGAQFVYYGLTGYLDIAGFDHNAHEVQHAPPELLDAVRAAYPFPSTIPEAIAETVEWEAINRLRSEVCDDGYAWEQRSVEVKIREDLVHAFILTSPACGVEDIKARMKFANDHEPMMPGLLDRLFADLDGLVGG